MTGIDNGQCKCSMKKTDNFTVKRIGSNQIYLTIKSVLARYVGSSSTSSFHTFHSNDHDGMMTTPGILTGYCLLPAVTLTLTVTVLFLQSRDDGERSNPPSKTLDSFVPNQAIAPSNRVIRR